MNPSASPGRTWIIFIDQRRVPVLARATAATFFRDGYCVARLSGLGGAPASAFHANRPDEGNPDIEPSGKWFGDRGMDFGLDQIPIIRPSPV
jgi:hypothetical protein